MEQNTAPMGMTHQIKAESGAELIGQSYSAGKKKVGRIVIENCDIFKYSKWMGIFNELRFPTSRWAA